MDPPFDLAYWPSVSDADVELARYPVDRALVVGEREIVGLPADEVRVASVPGPVLPSGTYLIRRGAAACDAVVCVFGTAPAAACELLAAEVGASWASAALGWFDHLWPTGSVVGGGPRFPVGAYVRIAGAERVGRVADVRRIDGQNIYVVTVDGIQQQVGEQGLDKFEPSLDDPVDWLSSAPVSSRELSASLTVTKLTNPLTDTVYSYLSSKTVFRPYQFRPVLRLLNAAGNRLLIADEVGLGKTIEAGLVWTELEARNPGFRRVLIVCPATLVDKWCSEMRHRFDRRVVAMTKRDLEDLIEMFENGDHDKPFYGVVSLERLRSSVLLERLTRVDPRFDLIIVDEAHTLRNPTTISHALGLSLSEWADALLFLSATPLNLHTGDLFALLSLLRPDEFTDGDIFPVQLEPNRYLNELARGLLDHRAPQALTCLLGGVRCCELGAAIAARPEFADLERLLDTNEPLDAADRAHARRLVFELHTLSTVLTRTRKVDLPADKAVREPRMVDVEWTEPEHRFYQAVLDWARRRTRGSGPVTLRAQMPLRQAASCLPAARQMLETRDPGLFEPGRDDLDDLAGSYDPDVDRSDDPADTFANRFIVQAAAALGDVDTKFAAFQTALEEARSNGYQQALVFSFFRRTLAYLSERLGAEDWSVEVMDGATPIARRRQLMADFRAGVFDVLLCSEVGSEGLDFEFCGVVVNYDLPWNPMKVEQRIGRIDRFGQSHEKIFVVNFHVPGTIETDIFERLYERIDVFRHAIGDLEPIIREELTALQHLALDPALTPAERNRRAVEIAVALEERRTQLDDLSEANSLLAGIDQLLIEGFEEQTTGRGRFVGPAELQILVEVFLRDAGGGSLRMDPDDAIGVLCGEPALAQLVSRHGVGGASVHANADLFRMLQDGDELLVTFDNELANQRGIDLLSLRHPVVKAAAKHFSVQPAGLKRFGSVSVPDDRVGLEAVVVLYLAESTGIRPSLELWPIAIRLDTLEPDDTLGDRFLSALCTGLLGDAGIPASADLRAAVERAKSLSASRQLQLEAERQQLNDALVDARLAAVRAGTRNRADRTSETLQRLRSSGADARIVRLHEGRLQNLQHRLAAETDQIESQRRLSMLIRPVAVAHVQTRKPEAM